MNLLFDTFGFVCICTERALTHTHAHTHTYSHYLALTKSSVVLVGSWAKIMLSWIHSCSLGKRTDPGTFHHLLCQTYLQKAGFRTYQLVLGVEMAPNPIWVCAFMTWFWLILSWFFQMLSTYCNCSILRRNPFDCWVGLKPSIPAVMTVLVPCGATGLASVPRKSGYALLSEIETWRVVVGIGRIAGGWSGHLSFWKHIAWIWQPGRRLVEILRYMRRSCSSLATQWELVQERGIHNRFSPTTSGAFNVFQLISSTFNLYHICEWMVWSQWNIYQMYVGYQGYF